jgi:hypothetical protein
MSVAGKLICETEQQGLEPGFLLARDVSALAAVA